MKRGEKMEKKEEKKKEVLYCEKRRVYDANDAMQIS